MCCESIVGIDTLLTLKLFSSSLSHYKHGYSNMFKQTLGLGIEPITMFVKDVKGRNHHTPTYIF